MSWPSRELPLPPLPAALVQVAAPYCPDPRRASAYVTNWAVSTVGRSIKLSWSLDPAAAAATRAAQAAQAAPAPPAAPAPQPAALLPPQAQLQPQPQAQPNVAVLPVPAAVMHQLAGTWQAAQAAQAALAQRQAAVNALMAQMEVGGWAMVAKWPGAAPPWLDGLVRQRGCAAGTAPGCAWGAAACWAPGNVRPAVLC